MPILARSILCRGLCRRLAAHQIDRTEEREKPRIHGAFHHAPERTRTSTSYSLTRPSTLRVYQFRHRRGGGSQHIRRLSLASVRGARYLHEHMFPSPSVRSDDVDLTKRQQEIFDFIKKYSAKHGYPPTVRDIGKAVGLASSSTVHAHLANLEKVGLLRRDPSKPRALELLDRTVGSAIESVKNVVRPGVPLVGAVAAGQPVLAEENIEDYIQIPTEAGGEAADFLLRVRGDSMVDAGILEDDMVVVRRQESVVAARREGTADDDGMAAARVGEEAPVKRFLKERAPVRLQRENGAYEP